MLFSLCASKRINWWLCWTLLTEVQFYQLLTTMASKYYPQKHHSSNLRNSVLEWPGDTPSHMMHGFNMDNLQGNRFLLKNKNYQHQDKKKKNPNNLDTPFQEKNHSSLSGKKNQSCTGAGERPEGLRQTPNSVQSHWGFQVLTEATCVRHIHPFAILMY